jgi:phage terminase large subunit
MDPELFESLLEQAIRSTVPVDLFDPSFPQQKKFYDDPAKLKILFCTRRSAKSFTLGLCAVSECLKHPESNVLLVGLTRASAKGIFWKDILKVINQKQDLGAVFNLTELTVTFPNGSVIFVAGIDDNEELMNAWLGRKYRWVGIDEGSLYTINLAHFIYDILKPAMADQRGTIALAGTSSNFTRGLFYDITTGAEAGWSLHRWTAHDNPFISKQWAEELEEIRALRPLYMETPQFRQWYLNEWVIETDKLVYKFNPEKNFYKELPLPTTAPGWTWNLSVDLGWEDDNAFVVSGYHDHFPTLYVASCWSKNHMTFDHIEAKIKEFQADPHYPISSVIIDGANKQGVETMKLRTDNIHWVYADKLGKVDHIEILNGDLIQERVKIHESCRPLVDEMMSLVWKTVADKIVYPKKEHPSLPNHKTDAFLYGWFNGWHFLTEPAKLAPKYGSPEYIKEQEDLHKQSIMEKIKRDQQLKENPMGITWERSPNGLDPWRSWD